MLFDSRRLGPYRQVGLHKRRQVRTAGAVQVPLRSHTLGYEPLAWQNQLCIMKKDFPLQRGGLLLV